MELRTLRRDRAARIGAELFLLERAFEDCLDRLSLMHVHFDRALLIGCPDTDWPGRLSKFATSIDVRDPGRLFAAAVSGKPIVEDVWEPSGDTYDLILTIGTLDTVNDLPRALIALRWAMRAGGLLMGAMSGGDTLPRLRSAMRATDRAMGAAAPHVHPRIEPSAFSGLLGHAGFLNPVIDVDRVPVSYRSFRDLVRDLRRMGATNLLSERSRDTISRRAYAAAEEDFAESPESDRTVETFEILHFACWAPHFDPER